ncbi:hypothetical protein DH2020_011147 [Rehmannia glutinosa]|uniref:Protein phosphatase n=1 Tax=Rehmannia glutinosa TaxID=99300 RepID=A0ABR0XCM7_REHGL
MADLFCRFLDFRSLASSHNLHLFLPSSKHYSSSALVNSHSSRINRLKRRPLHLTLLSKPSSDFDVISTHEHPDGSLLFRFGDPSEVAKNVKMEESKTVKEEIETEGENGYSVVKVFDGDHETEVMIKKSDREITGSGSTEVADHTNSIDNISKNVTLVEEDNDSCEKLLEGSNDIELPVLISSTEMEVTSTPVFDIEHIEDVEGGLNEEYEGSKDLSPVDTSILDKSSELENNIITVELSEKETAIVSSTPGVDIKHSENVEEGISEGNKDSSPVDASILEKSPDMENNITLELLEMETNDVTTSVSLISAPVVDVSDSDVFQANPSVETEMQREIIEDGKSDVVSPVPRSELAISLSEEIEEQNLPAGMQSLIIQNSIESDVNEAEVDFPPTEAASNLSIDAEAQASEIVEYESEGDLTQLMTVSTQLEVDSMLDEETGTGTVEEDDGAESLKVLNNMSEDLILGSERTDVDENVQSGEILEASEHESTLPESTESATKSQEILMTNFILSSGAVLPHPSKVLTGGEDAYFIAGQTWLGVADGVGHKNPAELLNRSVAETHSSGASTVLIAQFDGQTLHVANVGDSGFIVLRHGAIYKRSSPMHHVFHFPLLIERGDEPSSLAEFYKIDLEEDDVIITASDGLLDNLYDQEISAIVMKSLAADKKLEEIAELLATKAQEIGRSASTRSPFADDAKAAGFAEYTGGKLDDVAVIVSVVQKQSNSETL